MPDSIKFTELPSGTLSANSIFATAEEAGGGSYASTKVNAANIGNYLVGTLQYAGINTEDKTVEGALNELLIYASNIAEEYDSTATYDEGDFVIYEGVLYKCTTAISTPEEWTPAHWTSTLVVDNFGSGGGASVTLGTTAPSDSSGENGDLYVQYEALTYKVVEYFVKINNSWRKSPYSRVVALTQAEYDLITPDTTTLYIITDAQSSYQTKQDSNLQTTADTIVGAINELKSDIDDSGRMIFNLYDTNTQYYIGDIVEFYGDIYKCIQTPPSAGYSPSGSPTYWSIENLSSQVSDIARAMNIRETFPANTSIVTALGSIITKYGKNSLMGGFVITGYGFVSFSLSFSDDGQGGGYVVANNKGTGGNTPVMYMVQYVNGTVSLGYFS